MAKSKRRGNGEGCIRKRDDGLYEARITLGKVGPGKYKQRSVYGKTRAEVAQKLAEMLDQNHKGILYEPSKITVAQCVERAIANRVNIAESSRYKLRCESKALMEQIGDLRLQELRAHHVRDAYTELANQGRSLRAQQKAATHLRGALREAVHEEIVVRNVAEGVKVSAPRVEEDDKVAYAWKPSEVATFLEASQDDPLYPVCYLMLTLGLRRGEALGLPWSAVNLENAVLNVKQALSLTGKGNKAEIRAVKTPSSRRELLLSSDVVTLLRVQKEKQDEMRRFLGDDWVDTGLVFNTSLGTPIHPRNALRSFKRLIKSLDVTPIRLHDLRHTFATLALHRKIPVEVVSKTLGHARVDITLNVYRHLYDFERRAAALSLTELLSGQSRDLN